MFERFKQRHILDGPGMVRPLCYTITSCRYYTDGGMEGGSSSIEVYIGEDMVLEVSGVEDQDVYIGIRPEGFELDPNGKLHCQLSNMEVMGRDVSVVCTNAASMGPTIRAIVDADNPIDLSSKTISYSVKPHKFFLFNKESEERIRYEVK